MITIDEIVNELKKHEVNKEKLDEVKKSYNLAVDIHSGQFRQSGEPYIIHPLNVAKNLLDMEIYDPDTISAALLHDTIEDAKIDFTKEDIAREINPTVAQLVDGVTKMRRMQFSTKEEQSLANIRKITNGLSKDVRIILIKLADRLHNMRTLQYKTPKKQIENAIETKELFVPLALSIGAYQIKSLLMIKTKISDILKYNNIPNEILFRTKNICTTYQKILQGYKLENIYDLFYLKVLVNELDDCYRTLGLIHQEYPHINGRFKDYISNPKTNLYRSLHTTVAVDDKPTKIKIRTHDMDKVTAYGVSALWNIKNGMNYEDTQEFIKEKIPFVKSLMYIDETSKNDYEFIKNAKTKLLTDHVYVYDGGEIVELPAGSTALDFVYQTRPNLVDKLTNIIVNGKIVSDDYVLQNTDSLEIKVTNKTDTIKQYLKLRKN